MEDSVPDISIIVVNYQVKEYVGLLLHSIQKAAQNLKVEIFVIAVSYTHLTLPTILRV